MALTIRRDPLNALRTFAREYGDIVLFHVLMQERILLNHPDFIEQVLVIQQSKFHKSELTRRITARMLGQGLLTSEGEFWRRQRRLVQPAFHRSRINEYGATMREIAQAHISGWRDGEVRDLAAGNDGAYARQRSQHAFQHGAARRGTTGGPGNDFPDALFACQAAVAASDSGELAHTEKPPRESRPCVHGFARLSND